MNLRKPIFPVPLPGNSFGLFWLRHMIVVWSTLASLASACGLRSELTVKTKSGNATASSSLSTAEWNPQDNVKLVPPGTVKFTLALVQDAPVSAVKDAKKFSFEVTSGLLSALSIVSIEAMPNPLAPTSKLFSIEVETGTPTPSDSIAEFRLHLNAG